MIKHLKNILLVFFQQNYYSHWDSILKANFKKFPKLKLCLSHIKEEEKKIRKREESHKVIRIKLPMGKSKNSYYKALITNLMISDLNCYAHFIYFLKIVSLKFYCF